MRGPRAFELDEQVGHAVLERLEAADRPAELHAVLRVLHRALEQRLAGADHLGRLHERRELQGPVDRRLRRRRARPTMSDAGNVDVVERHFAQAPGEIDAGHDAHADAGRRERNERQGRSGGRSAR